MKSRSDASDAAIDRAIKRLMVSDNGEGAHGGLDDLNRRRLVNLILSRADDPSTAGLPLFGEKGRRPAWKYAVLAASLAVAVLTIWTIRNDDTNPLPTSLPVTPMVPPPTPSTPTGRPAPQMGAMDLAPGIRLLADPSAGFSVVDDSPSQLTIDLSRGGIWLSVTREETSPAVVVQTPKGGVSVTGTVFGVFVEADRVDVQLLRGTVRVLENDGRVHQMSAGHALTMGSVGTRPISPEQRRQQWFDLVDRGLIRPIDPSSPRRQKGATKIDSFPPRHPAGNEPGKMSIAQHQHQIRIMRQRRDWVGVARAYEQLIRAHRHTGNAKVAMVALGTVQLENLNNPHSALAWYEKYLATGRRALRPEAMLGKARALRAIGLRYQEAAVLEEFIRSFPDSTEIAGVKMRLTHLGLVQE